MRFVIDLDRTDDDRVEGMLMREGWEEDQPFSGWLDLIGHLEAAVPRPPRAPSPKQVPEFGEELA